MSSFLAENPTELVLSLLPWLSFSPNPGSPPSEALAFGHIALSLSDATYSSFELLMPTEADPFDNCDCVITDACITVPADMSLRTHPDYSNVLRFFEDEEELFSIALDDSVHASYISVPDDVTPDNVARWNGPRVLAFDNLTLFLYYDPTE